MKNLLKVMITLLLVFAFTGCNAATKNDNETDLNASLSNHSPVLDTSGIFTDRDLEQEADLSDAISLELISGEDILIEEEGVYLLSGEAYNTTVMVAAGDEAKVQLVLDNVSIINENAPAIYVKSADKVFVTSTDSDNALEVSDAYAANEDVNWDAVIFSKDDLVLNGTGSLEIISKEGNGITSKDDLKITGGTYRIISADDGLEANDSIGIYSGDITIDSGKDAFHSENDDEPALGYVCICGGTLNITAENDAIFGTSTVQIDGGTINIEACTEGIEGTYVQINGGEIDIYATDDGINAAAKSSSSNVVIEVNGGAINIKMDSGDTDAFDSNGNIYINGGIIDIEAKSAFDSSGTSHYNGGEVTVNGEKITSLK